MSDPDSIAALQDAHHDMMTNSMVPEFVALVTYFSTLPRPDTPNIATPLLFPESVQFLEHPPVAMQLLAPRQNRTAGISNRLNVLARSWAAIVDRSGRELLIAVSQDSSRGYKVPLDQYEATFEAMKVMIAQTQSLQQELPKLLEDGLGVRVYWRSKTLDGFVRFDVRAREVQDIISRRIRKSIDEWNDLGERLNERINHGRSANGIHNAFLDKLESLFVALAQFTFYPCEATCRETCRTVLREMDDVYGIPLTAMEED